jgi:4'-phosphopantetheinyl transferase
MKYCNYPCLLSHKNDFIEVNIIQLKERLYQKTEVTLCKSYDISYAKEFFLEKDRKKRLTARNYLRKRLIKFLGYNPRILVSNNGKPYIKNNNINFNISYSEDIVVIAISNNLIGVDIESIEPSIIDNLSLDGILTYREQRLIQNKGPEERSLTFFKIWTAKEAYLKCIGSGISNPYHLNELELVDDKIEVMNQVVKTYLNQISLSKSKYYLSVVSKQNILPKYIYIEDL